MSTRYPVAIIGAGPVGLAAAAHLISQGETPLLFEAGDTVGTAILAWGHVRLFSPWRYLIDKEAQALLEERGWLSPDPDTYPTGREVVEQYLLPLAHIPVIQDVPHLSTRVLAVSRKGHDKLKTAGRDETPFALRIKCADGEEREVLAGAVIDASGTYPMTVPSISSEC